MSDDKPCWVYWIHLEEHTDILTEGYIGITTLGVAARFRAHKNAAANQHKKKRRATRIVNCFKKYGDDMLVTTLLDGSLEYCQIIESKLRPVENVGWNLAVGGAATRAGAKNTPEHIQRAVEAKRGLKHNLEVVQANRERGIKQFKFDSPWEHPYCNKSVWADSDIIFSWFKDHPSDGRRTVGNALNMPSDSVMLPLSKIKGGWIPTEDLEWLTFSKQHKQKECYGT